MIEKFQFDLDLKPLEALKKSIGNKIIRQAVREVMKDVKNDAKSASKEHARFGYLARAWTVKVKTYNRSVVVGMVGPKSNLSFTYGIISRGPRRGQGRTAWPSKYEHFLESGTLRAAPHPILKPLMAKIHSTYADKVSTLIKQGIENLAV